MTNSNKTPTNKFAAILSARHPAAVEEDSAPTPVQTAVSAKPTMRALPTTATPLIRKRPQPVVPVMPTTVTDELPQRSGRPAGKGKSSDPTFRQVTIYLPQELHNNATIALRLANQTRIDADKEDFSEMLTRLLANWYENQRYYHPNA